MATESYLYEVLIRGTPDGKLAGAHMVYMDKFDLGNGEFLDRQRGPTPLDIDAVGGLLGKEFTDTAAQLMQAKSEQDDAKIKLEAATARIEKLTGIVKSMCDLTSQASDALA